MTAVTSLLFSPPGRISPPHLAAARFQLTTSHPLFLTLTRL